MLHLFLPFYLLNIGCVALNYAESGEANFWGCLPIEKHWEALRQCMQKRLNRLRCHLGADSRAQGTFTR